MSQFFHTFYARLSSIFLLLIFALGAGSILIAFTFTGYLIDEVEQLLNLDYAASMAGEIRPLVAGGFEQERIEEAIHYMMVLNPMVEIYVVNSSGEILAYFYHPQAKVTRMRIDLIPVQEFIKEGGTRLILGDDPRSTNQRKPFSAAPLLIGTDPGYLYIILRGQSFDSSFASLRDSYYLRATFLSFLLALGATLITGFSLFFLLTRRLRLLGVAVRNFKQGELFHRTGITGKDEIGTLGRAFNEMAEVIESSLKKLKHSEQMRRELVANISHDLRSPLTSVRGYLETILLKDSRLSAEKRREFLTLILRNIDSFQKLVEELFDLVMLETGQVQPQFEPVQILDLAQDIILKFKPQAAAKEVDLHLETTGDIPLLSADIGMLERILNNLIKNALDFTPGGGSVCLSVHHNNCGVDISVDDTGCGIAPEELPHIFERYYHEGNRSGASSGRTGLGLAITRQMVELHAGSLKVESSPGQGSRFSFCLNLPSV